MGKTRTAVIGEISEPTTKKQKQTKKKSLKEEKGVRIPGLKGGERVVAVNAEPIPVEKDEESTSAKVTTKQTVKPKTRGKKYKEAKAKIDKNKFYPLSEAVKLVKETSFSSFNGSVELHLVVKKQGLSIKINLPYSTGKEKKVEVADKKTIEKIKKNKIDFDVLLATPEMMPKLIPFAKILGPKGLMPNPKAGTIIKNLSEAAKLKSTKSLNLKTEKKAPLIHTLVGKVNQKDRELIENIKTIIETIGKHQILKAYLTATMGPSIKLDLS